MNDQPKPSEWTDERVELLKSFYPEGSNAWVARKINEQTGSVFSRNAIIGKANRIGLESPNKPSGKDAKKPRGAKRQSKFLNFGTSIKFDKTEPVKQLEFLGLQLDELTKGKCRFPRGDEAPYLFCGQPVKRDSSYCPYCHAITHAGRPSAALRPWKGWKPSNGFRRQA